MSTFLLTGLFTALTAFALFFAITARPEARRCEMHANRLRACIGRITSMEGTLDSLTQQLQKLRGQFYAFKSAVEDGAYPVENDPPYPHYSERKEQPRLFADSPPVCENYARAQVEGPQSTAARCDCNYCADMRHRRDEVRKALIPKTAAAQARRTKEAANGQE